MTNMPLPVLLSKLSKYFLVSLTFSILVLCTTLVSCGPDDEDPEPTPEEIAINEVYSAGDDWIELYNSSSSSKDIGGYRIYDDETDKYTIPAGTMVPAQGFLILNCDGTATGLNTNFKITADGETVYLENASGTLIDKAIIPALNNGQSYGRYPDGTGPYQVSGATTKGASNNSANAPVITEVTRNPLVVRPADDVTVSATVTSSIAIANVKLFYRFNAGSFTELNMSAVGSVYSAIIPATNAIGEVEYYVLATNTSGNTSRHPANTDNMHDYLLNDDPLPNLKINEFMALNVSCCPDTDGGVEEFDDWIEIYNAGDTPIDIGGMYLSDSKANPFGSKIPDNEPVKTTIPAHGYLVLWADELKEQGALHLNFKLSGTGEDIALFYIDGREIDSYTYDAQTDDKSFGRTTDGGSIWGQLDSPSQGSTND